MARSRQDIWLPCSFSVGRVAASSIPVTIVSASGDAKCCAASGRVCGAWYASGVGSNSSSTSMMICASNGPKQASNADTSDSPSSGLLRASSAPCTMPMACTSPTLSLVRRGGNSVDRDGCWYWPLCWVLFGTRATALLASGGRLRACACVARGVGGGAGLRLSKESISSSSPNVITVAACALSGWLPPSCGTMGTAANGHMCARAQRVFLV